MIQKSERVLGKRSRDSDEIIASSHPITAGNSPLNNNSTPTQDTFARRRADLTMSPTTVERAFSTAIIPLIPFQDIISPELTRCNQSPAHRTDHFTIVNIMKLQESCSWSNPNCAKMEASTSAKDLSWGWFIDEEDENLSRMEP